MSTIKTNAILDASGGNTTTINGATPTAYNTMGKNRIINGAMEIDQRNAGASVTVPTGNDAYNIDRWNAQNDTDGTLTVQQSTTAPAGFRNSLVFTTGTADTSLAAGQIAFCRHIIEGYNIADLAWGTSDAKTITISFWVRSSLTGTFGGSLTNGDNNRSYPFSYTISSANTWEQKTVTVAGDTTGTWGVGTGRGLSLWFGLGVGSTYSGTVGSWSGSSYFSATGATSVVGTNGATFYITGVQLEAGSVATEFERRPYGTELALCQRYYFVLAPKATLQPTGVASYYNNTYLATNVSFPTTMRSSPTVVSASGTDYFIAYRAGSSDTFNSWTRDSGAVSQQMVEIYNNTEISGTGGQVATTRTNNASAFVHFNAEL